MVSEPAGLSASLTDQQRLWRIHDQDYQLGLQPWLMGIVNVTPDSFSDGGKFLEPERAVEHALQLAADGADVLDIGGESTRPDAVPISADEELRRVIPVISRLAEQTDRLISIDTSKAIVAREAVAAGAHIINDISGATFDPLMPQAVASTSAGYICMHIQGTPQTMQKSPQYGDVVSEIATWLEHQAGKLQQIGVAFERIVFDPGIGFGKTAEHNLAILRSISRFRAAGRPVLIGHSRKRFLKKILQRELDEPLYGTLGVSIALAMQHVDLLRVHDVRATRDTLLAWRAIADASATGL